jgi:hypothetical protein
LAIGFNRTQAAAFLGNFFEESTYTLSPTTVQPNAQGRGFAQWSVGGRWNLENDFAQQVRQGKYSFETELDFMTAELSGILPTSYHDDYAYVKSGLRPGSLTQITKTVMYTYEGEPVPHDPTTRYVEHLDRREAAATVVAHEFGALGALLESFARPVLRAYGAALINRLETYLR